MKKRKSTNILHKAAAAALSLLFLSASAATLPPLPPERQAYERARCAFIGGNADSPVLIRTFLNRYPASAYGAEMRLMLADWYFYAKDYPLALSYYDQVPNGAFSGDVREGMLYRKAFAMIKTGFYPEARALLLPLAGSRELGDASRFYIAYIDYVGGKYDEAYEAFSELRGRGPHGMEAEYYLNQIDFRRGDYAKVARTSERLLSSGSTPEELLPETMRVGGLANFKLGDMVTARSILSRYAEEAGDGAEISALYALATIYYDEGDHIRALPLFTAVTEYPGDLAQSAWLYIGQMSAGEDPGAALAFDKAARESWNSDVARTAAFNLAVSSAEGAALPFADSAKAMEDFIALYPDTPHAASLSAYLANAYYNRRDYRNALRQAEKISHPDAASKELRQKAQYGLGVQELRAGKAAEAARLLEAAAAGPEKAVGAQASLALGDACYLQKNYSAAAKAFSAAAGSGLLGENEALGWYNLGYAYMQQHDYGKAAAAFEKAAGAKGLTGPQTADARLRRADALYYTGRYPEALTIYRALKTAKGDDAAYATIREADILGRNGNVEEKIRILENLTSAGAGAWQQTAFGRLADAYSEKGDDRNAARLYGMLADSASSQSGSAQMYYSLATNAANLYNSGDMEAALAAYRRLELSGIEALQPDAVIGIMRTSADGAEVMAYAAKAETYPELGTELSDEIRYNVYRADRRLAACDKAGAETLLLEVVDAGSDDNYWLARAYILLADTYDAQGKDYLARLYLETLRDNYPGTEREITDMIDNRLKTLGK